VPAPAVIPAPIAYSKIVAIKTLVVSPDGSCTVAVLEHGAVQGHFLATASGLTVLVFVYPWVFNRPWVAVRRCLGMGENASVSGFVSSKQL